MFIRKSLRQSVSKMDAFIDGTQNAMVAATFDFMVLAIAHSAGITLPTWLTHSLCLAIVLAVVCGIVGLVMEIIVDSKRARRANEFIKAYYAQNDRSKMYNFCKHDAK